MALGPTRFKGIRKLADLMAPSFRADISGLVDDIGSAVWPSGSSLPTATADKWPGRSFFHNTELTWYVCDGTNWLPVGGQRAISLATFGSVASGHVYDTAGGASYVYRSGKRVDIRLRIRDTSGVLSHGVKVFQTSAAYLPSGVGAWPLAAIQSGGAANAGVVGAVLDASGSIHPLSPSGISTTLEVAGFYFLP